ncbi:MAG: hypothetical protein ACPW60_10050 [Methylohalobius sp. ZOD2]|nr:hypothetical protein [Methylothermaceae bacterium]
MSRSRFFWGAMLGLVCLVAGNVPLMAKEQGVVSSEVASPAPEGSRQHYLSTTDGGKLLLSWVEGESPEIRVRFAVRGDEGWSKPRTVANTSAELAASPRVIGLDSGALAAAWMVKTDDPDDRYGARIYLVRSEDGGRHWTRPIEPYPAEADIYDAQMSLAALAGGRAVLVWTDKRRAKAEKRFQTMATVIDSDGKPGPALTVDDDVCSCCETGIAAQGADWLVAYRDHLPGEVRDISLAAVRGGEMTKRLVHGDHWKIGGCPSNGPAVAWSGSRVMVAWFTAADGTGRVKAAFSQDRGKTFGPPVEVEADANGYVAARLEEDGSGIVAWRGRAGADEALRVARVRPDGTVEAPTVVYRGEFPRWPSRHLGLARAGKSTYVAWTDPESARVRLARVPLAGEAARKPKDPIRRFSAESLEEIAAARSGRSFVLVFWSLDCPACVGEFDFLADYLKSHPDLDLVMVSTDEPRAQASVETMLAKHDLAGRVESWIFSEENPQKIRYAVDPNWYGELPRSYFYTSDHQRLSLSGIVTEKHFDAWRGLERTASR